MSAALPRQDLALLVSTSWRVRRPANLYEGVRSRSLVHHSSTGPQSWPLDLRQLGVVSLDTGALVVADPYVSEPDTPPFLMTLSAGEHRLLLGIARIAENHERTACALLLNNEGPIADWELALQPQHRLEDLEGDDAYYGFPVDAGTACVASPAAFARAAAVLAEDAGMLEDPLSQARFAAEHEAVIAAPAPGTTPVAVFTSGWGDGLYPTWLGLDSDGEVSLVLVDFLLNAEDPPAPPSAEALIQEEPRATTLWNRLRRRQSR